MSYLSKRYKATIAKTIAHYFDLPQPYEYGTWMDAIETLLNERQDILIKIAFQIYDFNSDHQICEYDLYTFLQTYKSKNDEDCFQKAFQTDIAKI